jgi:nitrate reductase NapAB chaperone NapD
MSVARRHYSGVLISAEPARFTEALGALAALADVEVHHTDASSARCVVVLESADREGQERLFRALRELPGVAGAELAFHWIDTGPEPSAPPGPPCEEEAS